MGWFKGAQRRNLNSDIVHPDTVDGDQFQSEIPQASQNAVKCALVSHLAMQAGGVIITVVNV
jgi:hypothetical protein